MMRISAAFFAIAVLLATQIPGRAETNPWDVMTGFPAYVTMQTYHEPIAASIMGKTYVYYEILALNAYGAALKVRTLVVRDKNGIVASYSGPTLSSMIRPLGVSNAASSLTIPAAVTAVIFVAVPFAGAHDVPSQLTDVLTFSVPKAGDHTFTVTQSAIRVNPSPPIAIEAPLRGNGWFAGSGPSNDSTHRRTMFYMNGKPIFAQRFAIDWVLGKRDSTGRYRFFRGTGRQNDDWYCWNVPLYAVADGVVVAERTDLPDNTPLTPKRAVRISKDTIGGNYVVLNIGHNRFAFYAHMRPHSATVKVGQRVKAGEILGRLGDSGNSDAPHLHFHIVNGPSFLFADGEPYAFSSMQSAQSTWNDDKPDDGATLHVPFKTYRNTMPGDGAIVNFGQ